METQRDARTCLRKLTVMGVLNPLVSQLRVFGLDLNINAAGEEYNRAYFWESCYVALTCEDTLVRLRALCQAANYLGKLELSCRGHGHEADMFITARNSMEALIRP